MAKAFAGLGATIIDTVADLPAAAASLEGLLFFQKDTNELKICDGTVWKSVIDTDSPPGLKFIKTLTISNTTTGSLDNVFTTEFDNYRLVFNATASSSAAVTNGGFRLRSGGATYSGATYYNRISYYSGGTAMQVALQDGGTSFDWGFYFGSYGSASADIYNPAKSTAWTLLNSNSYGWYTTTSYIQAFGSSLMGSTAAYDGFTFYTVTGVNITATIDVYGYVK